MKPPTPASTRRALVRALSATGLLACAPSLAQRPAKVFRIGVAFYRIPLADLSGTPPAFTGARILRESLRELGWEDGRNVEMVWKTVLGKVERIPKIMQELVDARCDVLVLSGNGLVAAAMKTTRSIPIVMIQAFSPVENKLVASLTRPGGNVTGVVVQDSELTAKRLQFLKRFVPAASRVAYVRERGDSEVAAGRLVISPGTQAAADTLGLNLLPFIADTQQDLLNALPVAVKQGANAVLMESSLAAATRDQVAIHSLMERHKLPVMHRFLNAVASGGLLAYGVESNEIYRLAAGFVDRILKGASPATMALEQPTRFRLAVNLKAARAIGLTIPQGILAQADEVIQ